MMRAVAYVVDVGTGSAQFLVHPAVQIVDRRLVVHATRHARLIGHDKHVIAALIEPADRANGTGKPAEIRDAMHIASVVIERAVAIEKYCRARRCSSPVYGQEGGPLTARPHFRVRSRD